MSDTNSTTSSDNIASFASIREQLAAANPTPAEYPNCCRWHGERSADYANFKCRGR